MAFRNTAIIAGTVLTGVLAYAVYFDHKRQSDPNFRKSLKKNNKKVEQSVKQQQAAEGEARVADLKNALESVKKNGELPTGLEEKEAYFMEQVAKGESLCASEGAENEAAISFWKALKVYPQPQDLMGIYERTVPANVLEVLAELIALDHGAGPSKPSTDDNIE
ncbi:uncharacterized protein N7529_002176 [Penicillium soppii]|uniref:uncharacterized protein n=1 Tax=Penicillium soppii TaxID=69789 RepID=UPI002548C75E|nr:uncharacterized protein N7529_002176 [Penicillium soppii]KAJ5873746.1 hypothetical protein N7529_002176 [Penicillium soppii]